MTDEPNIVKWPGWEELDKRFEPYALQIGWLAYCMTGWEISFGL
jgi:hypothetical protein